MKMLLSLMAVLLAAGASAQTQPAAADPLAQNLFPPDLVLQYQEEIGLTDKQRKGVIAAIQDIQEAIREAKQRFEDEKADFSELLAKEKVDEQAVLAQFDKLQQQQATQSRKQIQSMIRIKNLLKSDQQAKLAQLKKKGPAQFPPPALREKLDKLQTLAREWAQSGHDAQPVAELMMDFEPLIRAGKLKEANDLVDRAIKMVEP